MEQFPPGALDSLDSLEGVPPSREGQLTALIAGVLRVGVVISGLTVAAGFALLLALHQGGKADFQQFQPRAHIITHGLLGVFLHDLHRHAPRDLINIGLLLLILTPVVRVAFSIIVFLYESDRLYAAFTVFVLAVLLYSLLGA
jgi:uncharacterized membrane protein